MLRVGDKVVPISKSVGCSSKSAQEWKRAMREGQNFLYITKIEAGNDLWCACKEDDHGRSEYYLQSDLIPYCKVESGKSGLFQDFNGTKVSNYKVKDILHMVNMGILKHEDEIIFGRK